VFAATGNLVIYYHSLMIVISEDTVSLATFGRQLGNGWKFSYQPSNLVW